MRKWFALVLALAVIGLTFVASTSAKPVSSVQSSYQFCSTDHVHFAKTKFLFHAGLALGAFHHFIWAPYRQGAFKAGAPHRLKTSVEAGAAALFVYHELSEACKDANSSNLLKPLVHPLSSVTSAFHAVVAKFKGGNVSNSEITSLNTQVTGLTSSSPLPIRDLSGFKP